MLHASDTIKILIIMTSLQNIIILGAQGFLMLMGSKCLIKMTRLQNIKTKEHCFATWSSLSNILILSTSGDLEHLKYITMFCSEVMMVKIFNPIKSRRPWPPISILHLFSKAFLVLGHPIFTYGVFLFRLLL